MTLPCFIGCDIGGTFTDLVVWDPAGNGLQAHKLLTTPQDPSEAFLDGVMHFAAAAPGMLERAHAVLHATTLGINAIIERKGSRTALVTTSGFQDVLEIGREKRYDMHDIFQTFPRPLVPRQWRFEVRERVLGDGSIERPLDDAGVESVAKRIASADLSSIAVCFLHAYASATHERQAGERLAELLPGVALTLSSQVLSEIGEYERTSTTVANAYVKPLMAAYLGKVAARLADGGFRGRLYLMLSNGGLTSSAIAAEFPIRVVESGPAAGAMGAEVTARRLGLPRVLAFDMGGTTAKASVIRDARLSRAHEFEVAREARFKRGSGIPVRVPVVDLLEIGAGGGSIARPNAMRLLDVGPESAGADPGPACYARGGSSPTVTDADLVLGYLDATSFLGGRMRLDRAAATAAIQAGVATPLELSIDEAAWAIHDLVNENMAAAARVHFAEKAEEPEEYALLAFGGAGPVHAAGLAWKLGIRHVVIPASPGIFAALSFFAAPMMYDAVRTHKVRLADLDPAVLVRLVAELRGEAARFLEAPDPAALECEASLDMRYAGQGYDIVVPIPDGLPSAERIGAAFDAAYGRLYGRVLGDVEREVINVRLSARRAVHQVEVAAAGGRAKGAARPGAASAAHAAAEPAPRLASRLAWDPRSGAYVPFTVAQRSELAPGTTLTGPCIVEEAESTTVLPYPGALRVDEEGNLRIDLGGPDR